MPTPLGDVGSGGRITSIVMRLLPSVGATWASVTVALPFRSLTTTASWVWLGKSTVGGPSSMW
jgi:hypothetical protein